MASVMIPLLCLKGTTLIKGMLIGVTLAVRHMAEVIREVAGY